MRRSILSLAATSLLAACGLLGGCATEPAGTVRGLGNVEFDKAMAASRTTLTSYGFSIEDEDARTGRLVCRPLTADVAPDRFLGNSPARQIATLQLYREDGGLQARLSVILERRVSAPMAGTPTMISDPNNYSTVPNQTPAQQGASRTYDQENSWYRVRSDTSLEIKILNDIYFKLHPVQSRPADKHIPSPSN